MSSINNSILDLRQLDLLACNRTALHRLDARAKVLITFAFILTVLSYNRYEITALLPYSIFPAVMMARGAIPVRYIARKIFVLIPFIIIVGGFNPFFDRNIMIQIGSSGISGGWVSFATLLVRSILTIGAAFILIGTTGFTALCRALEQMGVPQVFVVQLQFLYRYIFVLADESQRVSRARELRSCGKKGLGIFTFGSLTGHLLLRTWNRADQIHRAMLARGFTGEFMAHHPTRFGVPEIRFVALWSALFVFLRCNNTAQLMGSFVLGLHP